MLKGIEIMIKHLHFRHLLNLQNYDKEKTHQLRIKLEGEYKNIECFLLVTISGTSMNTVYDVDECDKIEYQYLMQKKYVSFIFFVKRSIR